MRCIKMFRLIFQFFKRLSIIWPITIKPFPCNDPTKKNDQQCGYLLVSTWGFLISGKQSSGMLNRPTLQ